MTSPIDMLMHEHRLIEQVLDALERFTSSPRSVGAEDREVLVMRHFEQLSNADVARLLGLSQPGASLRYLRAARRLREILKDVSGSTAR